MRNARARGGEKLINPRRHSGFGLVIVAVILVVCVIMALYVRTVSDQQQLADKKAQLEKTRADLLQKSVNTLRARADQDRRFFELVRQLITVQSPDQKRQLVEQLRTFKFSEDSSTMDEPSSTKPQSTTTTTRPSQASRSPPSSTSTTSTTPCVDVPTVTTLCK